MESALHSLIIAIACCMPLIFGLLTIYFIVKAFVDVASDKLDDKKK